MINRITDLNSRVKLKKSKGKEKFINIYRGKTENLQREIPD